jgi:hypothetical protein
MIATIGVLREGSQITGNFQKLKFATKDRTKQTQIIGLTLFFAFIFSVFVFPDTAQILPMS